MVILYILLGIAALLLLFLLIPAGVDIYYDEKAQITLRYGFIRKRIDQREEEKPKKPAPSKPAAPSKPKPTAQKKPNPAVEFLKELRRSQGFSGLMEFLISLIRMLTSSAYRIVKDISVSHLDLWVVVRGEDAAQTAIQYGELCSVLYPAFGMLCAAKPSRNPRISVTADYEKGETQGVLSVSLRILPLLLLGHLLALAWRFLMLIVKTRSADAQPDTQKKNVSGQAAGR